MRDETAFIDALRALAQHPAARNLRDDAAVLPFAGQQLVLTHDMMVEGVHYLPDSDPADIAWKLVATNMSDLAAKGARPLGVLLGYILGDTAQDSVFAKALGDALSHYGVPLLGGDTVSGGKADAPRSFGLTAIGEAPACGAPSRQGAKPGDRLCLCGFVGNAMLGFEALQRGEENDPKLIQSFLRPRALLQEGQKLAPFVSAMMDVSDGLLIDAYRLAEASDVTVRIDSHAVPLSSQAAHMLGQLKQEDAHAKRKAMLRWGDDYALLFTTTQPENLPVEAVVIGEIIPRGDGPMLLDDQIITDNSGLGYVHSGGDRQD